MKMRFLYMKDDKHYIMKDRAILPEPSIIVAF